MKCRIELLRGLSAHADHDELLKWLGNFENSPKMTFVVHGEANASLFFADKVKDQFSWNTTVPRYQETFELFNGI